MDKRQTIKDLFKNDPEILHALEHKELEAKIAAIPKFGVDIPVPKDGIDGKDGRDGSDSEDGLNGKDGLDGINGLNGKDGLDGKNITTKEATILLQELLEDLELGISHEEAEKLVKKHVISATNKLSQSLATLRGDVERNYGGHGGSGGGVLTMEIPVGIVDGVNTIFTVSHNPSYIEVSGQQMVSQTQDPTQYGYTYSAPTVTFVNAPTQTPHSWYIK